MMNSNSPTLEGDSSTIRAILVDDEELLRQDLRGQLETYPEILIVGEAYDVKSAHDLILSQQVDVIFLDIRMPPDHGFDLLPLLAQADPMPEIIFVTAYDQYAIEAFENNALGYLTKPVHPERLAKTIARLKKTLKVTRGISGALEKTSGKITPPSHPFAPLSELSLVPLQDGPLFVIAPVAEICAIQSEGDYTRILIKDKKAIMVKTPIRDWEERLPDSLFLRISRSLMLNKKQMLKTVTRDRNRGEIHLSGITAPLIISRLEMKRIKESC
jgi:two-component system LytT family response regulator